MSMIIALAFVIGSFIIFFQLIRPAYEEAQVVRSEVISREIFVNDQQEAITQVEQLIQSYQSEVGVQNSVSQALPQEPDFAGALYQLNGIAMGNGLTLQSFTVSAPALSTTRPVATSTALDSAALVLPIGSVTFQMKFSATYENIKAFLGNIENNVRLFDVQSVGVQPVGVGGQNLYTVDLAVMTYYQTEL